MPQKVANARQSRGSVFMSHLTTDADEAVDVADAEARLPPSSMRAWRSGVCVRQRSRFKETNTLAPHKKSGRGEMGRVDRVCANGCCLVWVCECVRESLAFQQTRQDTLAPPKQVSLLISM